MCNFVLQLLGVTTDNASNNNTFIHSLDNWAKEHEISFCKTKNHFRCFVHVINLSVQSALTCLKNELSQVFC